MLAAVRAMSRTLVELQKPKWHEKAFGIKRWMWTIFFIVVWLIALVKLVGL